MLHRPSLVLASVALLAATGAPLAAQQAPPAPQLVAQAPAALPAAQASQAPVPSSPRQAITIQPITTIVGFYSAEFERAMSRSATLGIGASYSDGLVGNDDQSDPRYLSVDAKLRFYPNEQPLRGFSLGLTAGYTSITTHDCDFSVDFSCSAHTSSRTNGPSAGFQLDYGWLLGRSQKTVVALGLGAKRLFVNHTDFSGTIAYPTARISVGFAF